MLRFLIKKTQPEAVFNSDSIQVVLAENPVSQRRYGDGKQTTPESGAYLRVYLLPRTVIRVPYPPSRVGCLHSMVHSDRNK